MNAPICLIIWQISHKRDVRTILSDFLNPVDKLFQTICTHIMNHSIKQKRLAVCNSQTASPFHYMSNFGIEFMNLLTHSAKPHENHGNLSASCMIPRVQLAI